MNPDKFSQDYERLNKAQKQAVDTIDGPVMVIAGPGTGKTSILTLRIANLLKKTDTAPENILALTFTESGVYAMRKKLVSIVGSAGYKVNIYTFHGFCNEVIKQYPERFPKIIGSSAIADVDQIEIMEKIIEENDFEMLKPYGDIFFYVKPALSEIKNLKREDIGVEQFEKMIEKQEKDFEDTPDKVHVKGAHKGKMKGEFIKQEEQIAKNKELLKLYEAYEKALIKKKFYDFEDMIVEVIKVLKKDQDLLLILQENYHYILADEHQDANNSQNTILELLSNFHENPNLFIVGDEKQAIFRFQGASLENFFHFQTLYPKAKIIHLEENYRSTQPILDASHTLISNNSLPEGHQRISLISKVEKGKDLIHIYECPNDQAELAFIIQNIQEKIQKGVKPEEIAILYRDNRDAFPLAEALKKTDIPFRIESENDLLKDENIRKLLLLVEAVSNLSHEENLGKALFIDFLGLKSLEIYEAFDQARKEKSSLLNIVQKNFPDLSNKLESWASLFHNKPFVEAFEIMVRESGYLEHILKDKDAVEKMAILESFFNEVKGMAGAKREYFIQDFISHIVRLREHGIMTKTHKSIHREGVRLMTAHKSKGLEFDVVYIIGAYEGHWGNKTRRTLFKTLPSNENNNEDERRLFYVALTRARKEVNITYPKENREGREQFPSQFIGEISDDHKKFESIPPSIFKGEFSQEEKKAKEILSSDIQNKEHLQKTFLDQGLSVTALNNYLKCPWEYFFINLLRLPQAQSKHQMYGTAVHETLRTFFNRYREEEDMDEEALLSLFEFNLNKTLLSVADLKDSLKKGKEALKAYFRAFNGSWNRNLLTEYSIKGICLDIGEFELPLRGNLDKIEFIDDVHVHVVDYKTGKRKSSNKDNYYRQLTFYKLLLDLDEKKKYVMKTGELDFIEPDDKGKYKKEIIEISDEKVQELIELIKQKANEIYSLAFWNTNCDEKDCEYCALGKSLVRKE